MCKNDQKLHKKSTYKTLLTKTQHCRGKKYIYIYIYIYNTKGSIAVCSKIGKVLTPSVTSSVFHSFFVI